PPVLTLLGGEYFAKFLMYILRFNKLNKMYEKIASNEGIEFIDAIINLLGFKIELQEKELTRIPPKGSLIIVANDPYGGFDSLMLIKYLSQVRSYVKISGNFLMKKVKPISEYFIGNVYADQLGSPEKPAPVAATNEAEKHLQAGGVLCIFPAGELSISGSFE